MPGCGIRVKTSFQADMPGRPFPLRTSWVRATSSGVHLPHLCSVQGPATKLFLAPGPIHSMPQTTACCCTATSATLGADRTCLHASSRMEAIADAIVKTSMSSGQARCLNKCSEVLDDARCWQGTDPAPEGKQLESCNVTKMAVRSATCGKIHVSLGKSGPDL